MDENGVASHRVGIRSVPLARLAFSLVTHACTFASGHCNALVTVPLCCKSPTPHLRGAMTLFEKLGGAASMTAVADGLYDGIMADASVNGRFKGRDIAAQKVKMANFLSIAFGRPGGPYPADMTAIHHPMKITDAEFGAVKPLHIVKGFQMRRPSTRFSLA